MGHGEVRIGKGAKNPVGGDIEVKMEKDKQSTASEVKKGFE